MFRALAAAVVACSLSGCASLWWAGASEYQITPLQDSNGKITGCCVLTVHSGKQYATIDATFSKKGDDYDVTLHEVQVQAFKGQAIAAGAASDAIGAAVTAGVTAVQLIPK